MPKVLVGKRHDKVVFHARQDSCFPAAGSIRPTTASRWQRQFPLTLEANLLKGSPKITPSRARSLAVAAIREACEETGLCLGRKAGRRGADVIGPVEAVRGCRALARSIRPFPDRARDHPARPRQAFDTRFFTADASTIAHRVEGVVHADAELVELVWVELGSKPLADLHPMTQKVLDELGKRLSTGPLRHDAEVPFLPRPTAAEDAPGHFLGDVRHEPLAEQVIFQT